MGISIRQPHDGETQERWVGRLSTNHYCRSREAGSRDAGPDHDGTGPLNSESSGSHQAPDTDLQEAATQVHTEMKPGWRNEKHAQQWINTLVEYVFPKIGNLPIDQLQPRHIAEVLRPIWLEKAETASRVKQRIHAVMAWGWAHGFNQANPVDVVNHLLPQQPSKTIRQEHQPAMHWQHVPTFVGAELATTREFDVTRRALLFLILTGARSGEVRAMTWSEVNLRNGLWIVPADRMKARQVHRVPLSKQAVALLQQQVGHDEELVFPSIQARKVLSDMTLTALLRRLSAPSDSEGRVATAHGFRSSFRDWCSEKDMLGTWLSAP